MFDVDGRGGGLCTQVIFLKGGGTGGGGWTDLGTENEIK